jgi:hypothetical protein
LCEAHERKGRLLGQIRAAETLLDSLIQQMQKHCNIGFHSKASFNASASYHQPAVSQNKQLAGRPGETPVSQVGSSYRWVATAPSSQDSTSESKNGVIPNEPSSTNSHGFQSIQNNFISGYLAPTLLPASSAPETADNPNRKTCTVATSMGNFPGPAPSEPTADSHCQFQHPSSPWTASASVSPPAFRYEPERVPSYLSSPSDFSRMLSRSPGGASHHGPQATFLSHMDAQSPCTEVSAPGTVTPESRSAAVHSWLEHHHLSRHMKGPKTLPSEGELSDAPNSASLNAFLPQEGHLREQQTDCVDELCVNHHLESITKHKRRSFSITDFPPEQHTDVDGIPSNHLASCSTQQCRSHHQPDVATTTQESTASFYLQPENEVPKIEKWLRAVGKARGWDLKLLDDLLTQNLAAVLANDAEPGTQNEGHDAEEETGPNNLFHIAHMHPRSNPVALQVRLKLSGVMPMNAQCCKPRSKR